MFAANTSLIPSAPHYAALSACQATAEYKTSTSQSYCSAPQHAVSIWFVSLPTLAEVDGYVVNTAGSTHHTSQPSFIPGLEDVVVVLLSGAVGGSVLRLHGTFCVASNTIDWSRVIVRVPYYVPIQSKQLGFNLYFRNQTTFLSHALARSTTPRLFTTHCSPPAIHLRLHCPYEGVAGSQQAISCSNRTTLFSVCTQLHPDSQHPLIYDLRTQTCPVVRYVLRNLTLTTTGVTIRGQTFAHGRRRIRVPRDGDMRSFQNHGHP